MSFSTEKPKVYLNKSQVPYEIYKNILKSDNANPHTNARGNEIYTISVRLEVQMARQEVISAVSKTNYNGSEAQDSITKIHVLP